MGSRLFLYMGLGWLVCFTLFPVMLAVRMTPPRGDDWAGILGVFLARCCGAGASGWPRSRAPCSLAARSADSASQALRS